MDTGNTINNEDRDTFMEIGDHLEENTTKTLEVHAYDWTVRDVYGDDDHVAIHCWALDKESKPHLLRFTDFPAFCHVELPIFVRNHTYTWRPAAVENFMNMLSQRLGQDAPIRYIFKEARKTYYYRGNRRFPMVQLCFNNLRAMQHCSRLLENPLKTDDWGFIKCNVWEDSISVVRKLLTVRDVRYSQWFRAVGHKVEPELRVSTLEHEYIAEWDTMTAIPLEECKTWNTQPGVLAFDIECYSNNHRAMPDKYNALHVAYMISCIYQRYKDPASRRRYGIVIGDCNHIPPEKLANCEIITVNSEYEMVEAFANIVKETDPDILTGYNILGFDYPYLDHRVKRWLKQWPSMGRIVGEASHMTSKTWKSGAYGHQSINILQMEGRISIDLLPIVKRDYKLDKYDLNTVCKKFIGKTKHDVKASEMFLIYEDMRNTLTALVAVSREAQANPELLQDPEYIKRRDTAQEVFERAKAETTRVMEYCIQDSELVIELMEKMNIWVGLTEMSNIVGVTIVQLFTQGQQVRCLSQIYDLAARMGYILDKRDTPGFKFAGGFVYEPIPGLYENIICLDFSSLYPSIMMAYNICYTTLVPPELEDLVSDDDCHIIEFDQDEIEGIDEDEDDEEVLKELTEKNKKGKTVRKHYRFKFYKKQEGLLPRLVRQLVAERRAVNRQIVQLKEELKRLEKMEDVRSALEGYLNGTIQIMDVKVAAQRVKDFSESKPPAAPEIISAAKRDLTVAKLFNVAVTTKQLNDLIEAKPPTHPDLISLAQYELDISQFQQSGNRDGLLASLAQLNESRPARLTLIDSHKLLVVVLDKRQLAIKVSANSFFGFLGVHTGGKMPLIEAAMSITAKGRELIGVVRQYIEDHYGGVQIYGDTDSTRGHTPVLVRYETGAIDFIQIKDLVKLEKSTGKQEYYDMTRNNMEVWTDKGWTKIKYLMRHKTLKKLYRVVTHTGIVDVTEDHSLLNEQAQEITPNEIAVGMKLLHNNLPNLQYEDPTMTEDKAWAWGFFMAEGTCGTYSYDTGNRNIWSISNQNQDFLERAQRAMRVAEPTCDFIIDPCMKSSNVDKLNARGNTHSLKLLVNKYDKLFYTERSTSMRQNATTDLGIRFKKVPYEILMAPNNVKMAFLQGWYDGDGAKTEGNSRRFDIKGQIGAAGLFYIASAVGYKVSINTRTDKEEIYRLTLTTGKQRVDTDKIKKIIFLGYSLEDVFDIETENHHFGAGIGRMIVHNSVMMDLHIKDAKECNYWGLRLAQEISGIKPGEKDVDGTFWPDGRPGLFPPPLAMEFEKAMRLLCIKKKKYAAYLLGKDGNFKTEDITDRNGNVIGNRLMMLKKGIILARRDNCFTGDTLVTLSNGTSVAIKNMNEGNASLYGWNGNGLNVAKQTAFMPQGKKQCITINVIDGRKITCTPEHRLLVKQRDNSIVWKEAQHIDISADKVVCGLEAPEDIIDSDEIGWSLDIDNYHLDMTLENRSKTLAFMRILGYVNSDGSLSVREDGRIDCTVPMGHMIDANAMIDDIELICGIRPAITPRTTQLSSFYQIRIPNVISKIFTTIPGQDIGRRSSQTSLWPTFLLDNKCPKSVLREFCGGLLGGDGIAPYLSKMKTKNDTHKLDQSVLIGMSTRLENQPSMKIKMEALCDILSRAGYPDCTLSNRVEIYSVKKTSISDDDLRSMFRIQIPRRKCDFLQRIGYRYCIHKQVRHTAAQSLWRFEDTVKDDRMKTMLLAKQLREQNKLTYDIALTRAKEQILREQNVLYPAAIESIGYKMFYEFCRGGPVSDTTLKRYCTMPNTVGWLNDIGALPWFEQHAYSVSRDTMDVPVFYLPIHSRVDAGEQDVYDISVAGLESFVANGLVVHNCVFLRNTYTKILDTIMNKGGLDDAVCILVDAIQDLLDGKVPHEDLVIIRELGANYKSDSYFMKVFSDELKKAGKIVNPGDRLDFVIVEDPTATLLGHKMRLVEQYVERLNTPNPERIDYNYYIEKALMNPINQLFEVGFKDIIAQMQHVSYRPTNRHKTIYLDRPVQIILKMRERGYNLKVFKEAVRFNVMKLKGMNPLVLNVVGPKVPIPHVHVPTIPLTLNIMSTPPPVQLPPVTKPPTTPTLIMPRMALKTSMNASELKQELVQPTLPVVRPLTLNITTINDPPAKPNCVGSTMLSQRIQAVPVIVPGLNLLPAKGLYV